MPEPVEPEDLGNPEDVGKRVSKAKLAQRELDEGLRSLMRSPISRKWMWAHLTSLGAYASPFGPDPHMTYFRGGRQNVGLELIAEINRVCPELYPLMVKEQEDG